MPMRSLILLLLLTIACHNGWAGPNDPCGNLGNLYFVGLSDDGNSSVWLSVSNAKIKNAQLQGPNGQVIDNFELQPKELHLSGSSIVATGSAGEHFLYNIKNSGPCLIDSATQEEEILPGLPPGGGPPGGVSPPGSSTPGSGSSVLTQIVRNVNENFLASYLMRTFDITSRIDTALLRPSSEVKIRRWQLWVEPHYTGINAPHMTGQPDAHSNDLQAGVSYNINRNLLLGVAVIGAKSRLEAFNGSLVNKNNSVITGPYAGIKLFDMLLLDVWLSYGYSDVDSTLAFLRGRVFVDNYMAAGSASVYFKGEKFDFQPKFTLFYSESRTRKFNYHGVLPTNNTTGVTVRVAKDRFNYGRGEFAIKILQEHKIGHTTFIPAVNIGVNDNFKMPSKGHVLNEDNKVVNIATWSSFIQTSMGMKFSKSLRMDVLLGYYSLGVHEDFWDARVALTLSI